MPWASRDKQRPLGRILLQMIPAPLQTESADRAVAGTGHPKSGSGV